MTDRQPSRHLPVACDLGVFDSEERVRHQAVVADLVAGRSLARRPLPDGLELSYPPEPELVARLARWMLDERRCCPFLTFELLLAPGDDAVRLRLRGPAGTRELLAGL